jgi:hypothetical protein
MWAMNWRTWVNTCSVAWRKVPCPIPGHDLQRYRGTGEQGGEPTGGGSRHDGVVLAGEDQGRAASASACQPAEWRFGAPPTTLGGVGFDVDRLMRLWDAPIPQDDSAFRTVYADPVVINGAEVTTAELAAMARELHTSLTDQSRTVLEQVTHDNKITVVFTLRGVRNGLSVELLVIDLLTVTDGVITNVWAVSQPGGAASDS